MVIKRVQIYDDENKGFEHLPCGYTVNGNQKKMSIIKRLHIKKCEECKMCYKLVEEGKLQLIQPDVSHDREVEKFMRHGLAYKHAHSIVTNTKGYVELS